jgi:sugar phosphate isomerase/epimerase
MTAPPRIIPLALLSLCLFSPPPVARSAALSDSASKGVASSSLFSRDNLVAWCIVPFDAKQRGPTERAEMLSRLGIKRVAYDWRDHHIPEWDEELKQYKAHGIGLVGFWAPNRHKEILELLKRHGVRSQLWLMGQDPKADTQAQRVEQAAAAVAPVAKLAKEYGCTVGLYNHGGWFGQPENQVAIIEHLRKAGVDNVGIIYNLHHGHEHLSRFPEAMKLMKPHLYCLTINGMRQGGPKILPVGRGDNDRALLEAIRQSGYAGPIAILNHREEVDAEVGLRENVEGLKKLLGEMKDEAALQTYRD